MPIEEKYIATVTIPVHSLGKARVGQKVVDTYRIKVNLTRGLESTYHQKFIFKSDMAGKAQIITADLRLIERAFYGLRKLLQ